MLRFGPGVVAVLVKEAEGNQEPCGQYAAWQATEIVREDTLTLPLSL